MDPLCRNTRKQLAPTNYLVVEAFEAAAAPEQSLLNRGRRRSIERHTRRRHATLGEVRHGESGASPHGTTLRPSALDGRDMVTFDVEVHERSRTMPSLKPKQATSHPSHQWAARQSSPSRCSPRDMFRSCAWIFAAAASSLRELHGPWRASRGPQRHACALR
jgi:hypothetical protein